jgi:hypothetical protein
MMAQNSYPAVFVDEALIDVIFEADDIGKVRVKMGSTVKTNEMIGIIRVCNSL